MLGQQRLPAVQADGGFHCGTWLLLRIEEVDILIVNVQVKSQDQEYLATLDGAASEDRTAHGKAPLKANPAEWRRRR